MIAVDPAGIVNLRSGERMKPRRPAPAKHASPLEKYRNQTA
jgi:hypothetical protein